MWAAVFRFRIETGRIVRPFFHVIVAVGLTQQNRFLLKKQSSPTSSIRPYPRPTILKAIQVTYAPPYNSMGEDIRPLHWGVRDRGQPALRTALLCTSRGGWPCQIVGGSERKEKAIPIRSDQTTILLGFHSEIRATVKLTG